MAGLTKVEFSTVIVAKLDFRPGELAVMVAMPPVAEVTVKVAIAKMFPA